MRPDKKNAINLSVACSKCTLTSEDNYRIKTICKQTVDWIFFKEYIVYHRIYSIVYNNLKAFSGDIPKTIFNEIKEFFISNGVRNLFFPRCFLS